MKTPSPGPGSEPIAAIVPARAPQMSIAGRLLGRIPVTVSLVVAILVLNHTENDKVAESKGPPASTVMPPSGTRLAPTTPMRVALAPLAAPAVAPGSPAAEPCPPAPDINDPHGVAAAPVPGRPEPPAVVVPPATRASPSPRDVRTALSTPASTRAVTPRAALARAALSACAYRSRFGRDLCEVQQCRRAELRKTPVCMRILAGQRASLARLGGTPD